MRLLSTALVVASIVNAIDTDFLTDLSVISRNWGEVSPYEDNDENAFGIESVGLPVGCQIEQVHTLQRHGNRFPTNSAASGLNNKRFAAKVSQFTAANSSASFTRPLEFLNTYTYTMQENYLTGLGAVTTMQAGVNFWNRYGR